MGFDGEVQRSPSEAPCLWYTIGYRCCIPSESGRLFLETFPCWWRIPAQRERPVVSDGGNGNKYQIKPKPSNLEDEENQQNFQHPESSRSSKGHVSIATGALTVTIIKKYIILGELLKGKYTFRWGG